MLLLCNAGKDWFIVKMHLTMIESFSPFVELAPKLLAPVFEKVSPDFVDKSVCSRSLIGTQWFVFLEHFLAYTFFLKAC